MSMSTATMNTSTNIYDGEVLEKVLLENDLGKLSSIEKVTHIKNICTSLGLNPLTRPIQLIKFQGKEIMYATKDTTDQLRFKHSVTITKIDTQVINDCYIITAYGMLPNGRMDSATGVVNIKGLIGDALANAMMKAETKAKRRLTLSICGLGMLDESELDTMRGAQKFDVFANQNTYQGEQVHQKLEDKSETRDIIKDINDIGWTNSLSELQTKSNEAYKYWKDKRHKVNIERIIEAKDKRKKELLDEEKFETVDQETGEVINDE